MKYTKLGWVGCLFLGCADTSNRSQNEGVLVHEVTYDLAWDLDGSALQSLQNNLGYQVEIETAYLVHYSVQLIPCAEESSVTAAVFAPWIAIAGHGDENDPSMSPIPVVEALHGQEPLSLGTVQMTPNRYCGVHYLIGRANVASDGLPPEVSLVDRSLYVRGHWHKEGGQVTAFEWETELAYGAFREIPADSPEGAIRWLVTRTPDALFQDVDFEESSDTQQMWQFLINAVDGVHVRIESSE